VNLTSAADLNAHLATKGNVVQVSTYTRATLYTHRNAGCFRNAPNGNLQVRRGRNWDTLSHGTLLLVAIRTGRTV